MHVVKRTVTENKSSNDFRIPNLRPKPHKKSQLQSRPFLVVLLTPNMPKTYFCGLSLLKMTPKTRLVFLQPMLRTSRLFLRMYIYISLSLSLSLSFPRLSQGASRCWENLDFQKFQLALSLDPTAEIGGVMGGAVTNSYTGFPRLTTMVQQTKLRTSSIDIRKGCKPVSRWIELGTFQQGFFTIK